MWTPSTEIIHADSPTGLLYRCIHRFISEIFLHSGLRNPSQHPVSFVRTNVFGYLCITNFFSLWQTIFSLIFSFYCFNHFNFLMYPAFHAVKHNKHIVLQFQLCENEGENLRREARGCEVSKAWFPLPELTGRVDGRRTRCIFWHLSTRAVNSGVKKCTRVHGPSTRPVNSGSVNQA